MTLQINHAFVSALAVDAAASARGEVTPDRWNAALNAVMASGYLLGRSTAGNGAVEELSPATARALLGLVLGTAAGNVPVLDGSGKLATSILPALALTDTFEVASQAAMLALTAQQGDIAIRTDLNKTFVLSSNSPSTLSDWKELRTPTDAVLSVAGLTGTITAAALRTALNLVVGTNVQAYSGLLASIAGLTLTGNATKVLAVNAGATGFELVAAGGGSVIKSIQSGYVLATSPSSGTGEEARYVDIAITSVDVAKAFIVEFVGGLGNGSSSMAKSGSAQEAAQVTARLTSSTNLRLSCPTTLGFTNPSIAGRWRVVEAL